MDVLVPQLNIIPDIRDWKGCTTMWYATSESRTSVVRELLDTILVDVKVKAAKGRVWFNAYVILGWWRLLKNCYS